MGTQNSLTLAGRRLPRAGVRLMAPPHRLYRGCSGRDSAEREKGRWGRHGVVSRQNKNRQEGANKPTPRFADLHQSKAPPSLAVRQEHARASSSSLPQTPGTDNPKSYSSSHDRPPNFRNLAHKHPLPNLRARAAFKLPKRGRYFLNKDFPFPSSPPPRPLPALPRFSLTPPP